MFDWWEKRITDHTFAPLGEIYNWQSDIMLLHILADMTTAIAYFSIPAVLIIFAIRRPDVQFRAILYLFILFIFLSGATHLFDVWVIWNSHYGVQGVVKILTAIASVTTAVVLWLVLPHALRIPAPRQLQEKNLALQAEIERRSDAEAALASLNRSLELRVEERTRELLRKNEELFKEIEERRRLEKELLAARRRAEEASDAKSRFLATMSHEIRTPLNGVLGMANAVILKNPEGDYSQDIRVIRESGDALLALLNDIIDLSKVEAGKLELHPAPTDVTLLARQLEALWTPTFEAKDLAFEVTLDPDLPDTLLVDSVRLRQIIQNLLSNAVKFTNDGTVTLRFDRTRTAEGAGRLSITVQDTGIGVPEGKCAAIFGEFEQADDTGLAKGGSGLGLAICKRIAELMDGTISLDSVYGEGSRFTVDLPLLPAEGTVVRSDLTADLGAALPVLSVLAVDDNLVNRTVVTKILDALGHRVALAEGGQAAIDQTARQRFDIILMDIRMPGIDGIEAMRRIRASPGPNRGTPILALTAHAMHTDRETLLADGFDDYLAKPIDVAALVSKLTRLSRGDAMAAANSPEPVPARA